ncbi:MAG TPA: hypothetical protein GXX64_09415, partial [Bacteroidales bacterium]|nr:hypothetical protein [Bacteroidales bacterium]
MKRLLILALILLPSLAALSQDVTGKWSGVLRYDDRGTAYSTGDFSQATTLDFSYDAEAALDYLMGRKEVNRRKIGLMGHSEGGIIAPMVASRNKNVAFTAY